MVHMYGTIHMYDIVHVTVHIYETMMWHWPMMWHWLMRCHDSIALKFLCTVDRWRGSMLVDQKSCVRYMHLHRIIYNQTVSLFKPRTVDFNYLFDFFNFRTWLANVNLIHSLNSFNIPECSTPLLGIICLSLEEITNL